MRKLHLAGRCHLPACDASNRQTIARIAISVYGNGERAGEHWLFANACTRWMLQQERSPVVSCLAKMRFGMPQLHFAMLPQESRLLREWWAMWRSRHAAAVMARQCHPDSWFPRAYLGFTREQMAMFARTPAARGYSSQAVLRLCSHPDLWLVPASPVDVASGAVRPVALYWDISSARRYFNRWFGMIIPPPFRVQQHLGRWHLPGEVDVNTQILHTAGPLRHRMVA